MSQRLAFSLCLLTVAVILGAGFYLEVVEGIMPCPLCTLQRISFGACGIVFLIGIFAHRIRFMRMAMNFFAMLFSIIGIILAGRQIWIQAFPNPDNSECGVSINYLLSVLPVKDVAQKIFSGSTECSQRGWEFLKLNIPEWSLLFFILFLLMSLIYLAKDMKHRNK